METTSRGPSFRVQSTAPMSSPFWPGRVLQVLLNDRAAAVSLAAKSWVPTGEFIEVVHIASGEVVFRKEVSPLPSPESFYP
jgi:hypothetical protein